MPGYELTEVQYSGGIGSVPTATVRVKMPDGSEKDEAATSANGPVDAVFKALERALPIGMEMVDYKVSTTGKGSEAIGRVAVEIERDGEVYAGTDSGTDIIIASAKAIMYAVNAKVTADHTAEAHAV